MYDRLFITHCIQQTVRVHDVHVGIITCTLREKNYAHVLLPESTR